MSSFFSIPRTSQLSFLTVVRARLSANGPPRVGLIPFSVCQDQAILTYFGLGADAPFLARAKIPPHFGVGENTCRFLAWAKTPPHFL